jgi:hypothetical protein
MLNKQQRYLKSIFAHSGLYIITPKHEYSKDKKMLVKIGIAEDFHDRFGSYLLCYPDGFYVFGLFITSDKTQAIRLERSIHKYLVAKYKFIVRKHSHSEEVMSLNLSEVATLIETIDANVGVKFNKGEDIVSGKDQAGFAIFPYLDTLKGIFLDENLAKGGTRIKPFNNTVENFIDANYMKKPIPTSVVKKKRDSFRMPTKGVKIISMAAWPDQDTKKKKPVTKKKKK